MANAKVRGASPAASRGVAQRGGKRAGRRAGAHGAEAKPGLRERKKARLRQEIIETALRLFRAKGYENTRVEDVVQVLEISQPTFFRYFPTKDAVLYEVGNRGYSCITEKLKMELSSDASTADRFGVSTTNLRTRWRRTAGFGKQWCCLEPWTRCGRRRCADKKKSRRACCRKFSSRDKSAKRSRARFPRGSLGRVHGSALQHGGAKLGVGTPRVPTS